MTTYTWPLTINGVTFTAADFAPYAYVTGLPNLVGNMVASYNTGNPTLSALGVLTPAADKLAYFSSASTAAMADLTAAGRALLDDADAGEQRSTLGLGTAATQNTGTSGATVPLLNGHNVFSGTLTATNTVYLGGVSGTESLQVRATASAVNYSRVSGGGTAVAVSHDYLGSDANIFSAHGTKGAGSHYWFTNTSDRQVAIVPTSGAVNYWQITGGATGGDVLISATGSDTNVSATTFAKGSGDVNLATNASGNIQVRISHVAGTVNRTQFQGAATANAPFMFFTGADTNVNGNVGAKGTGALNLFTGNTSNVQVRATHTASAVNYFGITGAATAGAVIVGPAGTDTDISSSYNAKGAGSISLVTGGGRVLRAGNTNSAVNYAEVNGGAASVNTTTGFSVGGADTNIFLNLYPKGAAGTRLWGNGTEQARVGAIANSVNYLVLEGGAAGSSTVPALSVNGVDSSTFLNIYSRGSSGIRLWAGLAEQARFEAVASAVNIAFVYGSVAGSGPSFAVGGADTNVDIQQRSKGAGTFAVVTGGGIQFKATHATGAVNWAAVLGATTTSAPEFYVDGFDANISMLYRSKGTNGHRFFANGVEQVRINGTTSAVNRIEMTGSATGNGVTISAAGSDAHVALVLTSKNSAGISLTPGVGTVFITPDSGSLEFSGSGTNLINNSGGTKLKIRSAGADVAFFEANSNVALGGSAGSYGGGQKVVFLANCSVAPATNPIAGVIVYAEGGALKARGSNGTVTTLASA